MTSTPATNVRLKTEDTDWLDSLSARCSGVSMRERLTRSDVIRALVVVGRRHASEVRAELLEQRASRSS